MVDRAISGLDFATSLTGDELFELVQAGQNRKALVANISQVFETLPQETSLGITVLSPKYPWGCAFRYMDSDQIEDVQARTLLEDVTDAIQAVFDLSSVVQGDIPDGLYLITSSITRSGAKNWCVRGRSLRAGLVNKAPPGNPTLDITDCTYVEIANLHIGGRAGFPNHAFNQGSTGSGLNGFWRILNVATEPNGYGFQFFRINTLTIQDCKYWPSGGMGMGATADSGVGGTRKYGLLVDEIAGQYFNQASISHGDFIGIDSAIVGARNIRIATPNLGDIQAVTISGCEVEGTDGSYFFKNIFNFEMSGTNYGDDARFDLSGLRYGSIKNLYNPHTITIENSVDFTFENVSQGDSGSTIVIDSSCVAVRLQNFNTDFTLTNSAPTTTIYDNVSIAGVRQDDRLGNSGLCTYGRVVADGVMVVPAFAAGDFTAGTGTWTVESGDVNTYAYEVHGKTMTIWFAITGSTTASGCTELRIAVPAGFTVAAKDTYGTFLYSEDNGTTTLTGQVRVAASSSLVRMYKNMKDTPDAYANVTNLMRVRGLITFPLA